jgi:phosphatidate phosphatase APP1
MAGSGRKTFTAGEVLTASDVNGYLMDQMVMNFAGTAARASAIPTPSEGMVTHIGGGTVEVYDGSAWVTL